MLGRTRNLDDAIYSATAGEDALGANSTPLGADLLKGSARGPAPTRRNRQPWPASPRFWKTRIASSGSFRFINWPDRKSTRLNSSHLGISYAVFCLKKK